MVLLLKRREEKLTNRGADASVTAGESMAPSEAWLKRIEKSYPIQCHTVRNFQTPSHPTHFASLCCITRRRVS